MITAGKPRPLLLTYLQPNSPPPSNTNSSVRHKFGLSKASRLELTIPFGANYRISGLSGVTRIERARDYPQAGD